ncbi:MAG: hypothetical protein ACOWWM_10965 [Desulfobacterales bacterium]
MRICISSENAGAWHPAGWTVVDYGPMRLRIQASAHGRPEPETVLNAARAAPAYLDRVVQHKHLLARRVDQASTTLPADDLAACMVRSVAAIGDADLTPMAAVAGTLADAVADQLFARGMTRVIVDNGGDIAIRLAATETVRVGVRSDIRATALSHILRLDGRRSSWGVATSGFGGRSFTRGIASAVSAVGTHAAIADAAATAIANTCMIEDSRILQLPAEEIDPNTDMTGIPVTVTIGPLPPESYRRAIERALGKAEDLSSRGIITGALVAAGGMVAFTSKMAAQCGLDVA